MIPSSFTFVNNRRNRNSITDCRIKAILWYFEQCNVLQNIDRVTYSKKWVKTNTRINFEDYLKFKFIEEYLSKNKNLLKDELSELEEISFNAETQKRYIDFDNMEKVDKIDIYVNRLGIQNIWNEVDENVYFAIECKRIKSINDTLGYISDIEKFVTRNHTNLRLPFEGQLAFVEDASLNNEKIKKNINVRLENHSRIKTQKALFQVDIHPARNSYSSTHTKNFKENNVFSIYHLFFNYSKIVVD